MAYLIKIETTSRKISYGAISNYIRPYKPTLISPLLFFPFLMILSQSIHPQEIAGKTRVGIVEFKEENDIGLENAGVIIPEWLASEFVRIGRYQVSERLSLEVLLKEQALGQTGLIEEQTAAKVGKLYGVDGIVTGSVMKIGSIITVTGRIIAVETGRVLKSSVVRASSLDDLPNEIEVLANELCDISRAEFEIAQDLEKRSYSYLAIGGGPVLSGSENSGTIGWVKNNFFTGGLAVTASFTANRYTAWLQGIPIGGIKNLLIGGAISINQFWGLAAETGFIADDKINSVFVNYYSFGLMIQPRHEMSVKVLVGGSSSGTLWLWDASDPGGTKETVDGFFRMVPPATYSVEMLYRINPRLTVLGKIISTSLEDFSLKQHQDPLGKFYKTDVAFIALQWEFP
ncbi:hypothetical protein JYT44_00595, partial [Caldithrix abyssi]|nr:hypothetical protein [Caldithrix abyssi]